MATHVRLRQSVQPSQLLNDIVGVPEYVCLGKEHTSAAVIQRFAAG